MKKKKDNYLALIIIVFITMFIASFTALYASSYVFIQLLNCDSEINESFFNGTQVGYQLGVMDTGNFVLETGMLPVFINGSYQYLNLTMVLK